MSSNRYGVPYQGSKNRFCRKIIDVLEEYPHENFVDLFAGGCAVTHCAMESEKWKKFIINDISPYGTQLFMDAMAGKYKNETRWISREAFYRLKDEDAFVRLCWSFGNDEKSYMYSKEIEPYKKAVHEMIMAETWQERQIKYRAAITRLNEYLNTTGKYIGAERKISSQYRENENINMLARINDLETLQSAREMATSRSLERIAKIGERNLERAENVERLQNVERLPDVQRLCGDYRDVEIPGDSLIYCDIPYKGVKKYTVGKEFDYEAFYDWCEKIAKTRKDCDLIISEYAMPEDRFEEIAKFTDRSFLSATSKGSENVVAEKLWKVKNK